MVPAELDLSVIASSKRVLIDESSRPLSDAATHHIDGESLGAWVGVWIHDGPRMGSGGLEAGDELEWMVA